MRAYSQLVFLLAFLAVPAFAGTSAFDDMTQYADGSASFYNQGQGWQGSWQVGPDAQVVARSRDSIPRLEVSGGNTVRALIRRLARPEGGDGQPVYFRSDYSIEGSAIDAKQMFGGWYFVDEKGYSQSLSAAVLCVNGKAGVRAGNQSDELEGHPVQPGQRHTLIACLDGWDASRKVFTTVTVWLDPDKASDPSSSATKISVKSLDGTGPVELLYFRTYNMGEASFHLYRVSFASSWAEILKN